MQIVSVVPGSVVIDARAYDSEDSYGPSPDPPLNSNLTSSIDYDLTPPPSNFTVPPTGTPSDFTAMLQSLSNSVKSGDLETQMGVRVSSFA